MNRAWIPRLIVPLCAALLGAGGCGDLECGPGTEKKVDDSGRALCVTPPASGVVCDMDAGATIVGGVCVGDPEQFPTCGPGTTLDPGSNTCVPDLPDGGG